MDFLRNKWSSYQKIGIIWVQTLPTLFLESYLRNRTRLVDMKCKYLDISEIKKRVLLRSVLGPVLLFGSNVGIFITVSTDDSSLGFSRSNWLLISNGAKFMFDNRGGHTGGLWLFGNYSGLYEVRNRPNSSHNQVPNLNPEHSYLVYFCVSAGKIVVEDLLLLWFNTDWHYDFLLMRN